MAEIDREAVAVVSDGGVARSTAEIVQRIEEVDDLFGTQQSDLLEFLPFLEARPHLKDGATEADWLAATAERKAPLQQAREDLGFAWGKANDERGLSAIRSLYHFKAWLWLAGVDAELLDRRLDGYCAYGKPQLVMVSEALGFDWKSADDGYWSEVGETRKQALIKEAVAHGGHLRSLFAASQVPA